MMNFQLHSEELLLLESTRLSSLSSLQNDSPIANNEVNILSLNVGHPNFSFAPFPLHFIMIKVMTKIHQHSMGCSLIQKKRMYLI